jgi:hypothetical protein
MFGKHVNHRVVEVVLREMGRASCGSGDVVIAETWLGSPATFGVHAVSHSARVVRELWTQISSAIGALAVPRSLLPQVSTS